MFMTHTSSSNDEVVQIYALAVLKWFIHIANIQHVINIQQYYIIGVKCLMLLIV